MIVPGAVERTSALVLRVEMIFSVEGFEAITCQNLRAGPCISNLGIKADLIYVGDRRV